MKKYIYTLAIAAAAAGLGIASHHATAAQKNTWPIIYTLDSSNVTSSSATLNGLITPRDGATNSVWFEYGNNFVPGNFAASWPSKSPVQLVNGSAQVKISATLNGLKPNTLYYYHIQAKNSAGQNGYGPGIDISFRTLSAPAKPAPVAACANGSVLSLQEAKAAIAAGSIKVNLALDGQHASGTVWNNTGCAMPVSQTTYKMFDRQLMTQQLFSSSNAVVAARSSAVIRTTLASCMSQTDMYYGYASPEVLDNANNYPNNLAYAFSMNNANNYYNASGNFCRQ